MLDKEAIKEAADIQIVAEEIGIPMSMRGRKPMILCPCHDDEHFGSCFLNLEKNTFKCYSCGAHGDVFRLVQAALNVSFEESQEIVADTCGGSRQFELNGDEEKRLYEMRELMIPRADQDFIGLSNEPVYADIAYCSDADDLDDYDKPNAVEVVNEDMHVVGYRVRKRATSNPLYDLMQSDKEMYRRLIDDFCQRTVEKYQRVIDALNAPFPENTELGSGIRMVRKYATDFELIDALTRLIKRAQNISAKYGDGRAITANASPDIARLSALANSIWAKDLDAPF